MLTYESSDFGTDHTSGNRDIKGWNPDSGYHNGSVTPKPAGYGKTDWLWGYNMARFLANQEYKNSTLLC